VEVKHEYKEPQLRRKRGTFSKRGRKSFGKRVWKKGSKQERGGLNPPGGETRKKGVEKGGTLPKVQPSKDKAEKLKTGGRKPSEGGLFTSQNTKPQGREGGGGTLHVQTGLKVKEGPGKV